MVANHGGGLYIRYSLFDVNAQIIGMVYGVEAFGLSLTASLKFESKDTSAYMPHM